MVVRTTNAQILLAQNLDSHSQTTKIAIDTENSIPITILYKLRDTWNFKVGGGLAIRNIIFDAIDSSIDYFSDFTTRCLENGLSNCCSLTSSYQLN